MAVILQTTHSNVFSWMENYVFYSYFIEIFPSAIINELALI